MIIVFRASGSDFDPQGFAVAQELNGCSFWLRGQRSRLGKKVNETSGFHFPLPNGGTDPKAIPLIQTFLTDSGRWIAVLNEEGIRCEIDIGMTVGGKVAFTASVTLEPSFLGELANRRIGLTLSAYPSGV